MDKQTYTQRVQALAEEMAIDHFEKHIAPSDRPENGWDGLTNEQKKIWLEAELSRARIAIAKMAEAILIYAYQTKENYEHVLYNCPEACEDFHKYLKEQGLIPDNAQEVDNNGNMGIH